MKKKSDKVILLILGIPFLGAVILGIVLIARRGEHYPPYSKKTDWQRCQGASCKAPWAKSKDFGNGDCHTPENYIELDPEEDDRRYLRGKRKVMRHKYSPGSGYGRVKLRLSNRHGRYRHNTQNIPRRIFQQISRNFNREPDTQGREPDTPSRDPDPPKTPPKAPPKTPPKAPDKPPEKVVEKFPSSGRRYCYSTGSKVFAGTK